MSFYHMFMPLNATASGRVDDGFICGPMGCHGFFGPMFGSWGWFFIILWIIFWILLLIAFLALIRWLWKKGDK